MHKLKGDEFIPPIVSRDLSKMPPRSPYEKVAGFVILARAIDKCRADIAGTLGEYKFSCPLVRSLFSFKKIDADDFKTFVSTGATDQEIGIWMHEHGEIKTPEEIKEWSDAWDGKFDEVVKEDEESFK